MPFDAATLAAYLAAAAVLVLVPGPATAWILAQAASGGTRNGIVAGFGLETATLAHAVAASAGLSALLAASAIAFETVKYAGAAYLLWLGLRAWRSARRDAERTPGGEAPAAPATRAAFARPSPRLRTTYLRSFVTGLLNPKVALFFLAFLPQFVHPERGLVWLQFLVLGALLSLLGFAGDCLLSLLAGRLAGRRPDPRIARLRQRATGALFMGLGVRLALQSRA